MRYAILFSGMSFRRHLNGLEFCYRTLLERLGFSPEDIQVLSYDGSMCSSREDAEPRPAGPWPGDQTPYRLRIDGPGSREAFCAALRNVATRLGPEDQLFINITGSGGHHGPGSGSDLIVYPHSRRYRVADFCADLATLPPHRSLLVLMSQCFSGGFNQPVLEASPARYTFIAAAADEDNLSFTLPQDLSWDAFQRNFMAGIGGQDADGRSVGIEDALGIGVSTPRQAFEYACSAPLRSPFDTPRCAARPEVAMDMNLFRQDAPQS